MEHEQKHILTKLWWMTYFIAQQNQSYRLPKSIIKTRNQYFTIYSFECSEEWRELNQQIYSHGTLECVGKSPVTYMWNYQVLFDVHQLFNSSRSAQRKWGLIILIKYNIIKVRSNTFLSSLFQVWLTCNFSNSV